jgi:hypothetical protein
VSDLTKTFDVSRQTPSGKSLDELRHSYYIQSSMDGSDANNIGGLAINTNGRESSALLAKKKEQQATNDIILLAELQRQLDNITNNMIDKYGEDFAEQFAAEFLDENTFTDIIKIEDDQERRAAFAQAINDGIKNGTIDIEEVSANPDFKEWLTVHDNIAGQRALAATQAPEQTVELVQNVQVTQAFDNIFG